MKKVQEVHLVSDSPCTLHVMASSQLLPTQGSGKLVKCDIDLFHVPKLYTYPFRVDKSYYHTET